MPSSFVLAFAWNPTIGVPMAIGGAIVLALLWLFGQPHKEQGTRRPAPSVHKGERVEPVLGERTDGTDGLSFSARDMSHSPAGASAEMHQGELDMSLRAELERLGATLSGDHAASNVPAPAPAPAPASVSRPQPRLAEHVASIVNALRAPPDHGRVALPSAPAATVTVAQTDSLAAPASTSTPLHSDIGRRPAHLPVERIVSLFVVARDGALFNGPNLIVAAEKAGLEFGDMGIYHRLLDGKRELGPIFSVANMLKPGNFDLTDLDGLHTPGVSFFMTLPAPLPALDAWDAMLPTAQRMAELLDGLVLDEERNALGRQCVAHIRDQLRSWDRDHEGDEIIFGR
ncbi:MAG: cell division protein ZipA [Rhodanobacter sp.]